MEPRLAGALLGSAFLFGLALLTASLFVRRWERVAAGFFGLVGMAASAAFVFVLAQPPEEPVELFAGAGSPSTAPNRLRVVQLNVLHDYPEFADQDERADLLLKSLREIQADIVVLQEAWRVRQFGDLAEQLADELGLWAAYARSNGSLRLLGFEEGSAVLSRFPIRSAERLSLVPSKSVFEHRIALRVEIEVGDRIETVVGTHLANAAPDVARSQAESLLLRLEDEPPLIIAGDLNLRGDHVIFERFSALGYESLEPGGIDHVLVRENDSWRALWSEVVSDSGSERQPGISDHPAILAELASRLPPQAGRWQQSWQLSEPATLGFDVEVLERTAAEIGDLEGVTSLLVLRHGAPVVERYFRGARPQQLHNLKSASKSVLSALAGIAVGEDLLDLDSPLAELLPGQWAEEEGKQSILVRHLLMMSSGLDSTSFGAYGSWVASRDWVRAALERDLVSPPGTQFSYSTGNTHLLSAVLTKATGRSTLAYAREKLFEPLGIDGVSWARDPRGIYVGGNNLAMRPRDMARFGQLYLDRGRWRDEQVVPWQWVEESTQPIARTWRGGGYGYLWWMRPSEERGAYQASGYGGQYIYVSPSADLVIVITSTEASKGRQWRRDLFSLVRDGVIGSLGQRHRIKTPAAPQPRASSLPGRTVGFPGS
jgi:CubicO group peptidase (beta-lactamase class C family)/endonuclease/exonuclease/phosphatase family metal-dependent hydrolase